MGEEWRPPAWMFRDTRPQNDDAYFENMTRTIFAAGLNWKMIDKKWSNLKEAFQNFSINKVAQFTDESIKQLMDNPGIVRNRAKVLATINNAKQFQNIRREFGSFQRFIDSLNKTSNYETVVEELSNRFSRVGPSSARIFLYSVGEKIEHSEE